ncbi:G-protein coupled bile acid receptor 1 [Alosa pseudoharengus]|uniref:G-protein coupled bile acid receptor 1 n=1 Tax=Alosa pseudoharengus TaxID=34774 RepID=UPI003F8930E7
MDLGNASSSSSGGGGGGGGGSGSVEVQLIYSITMPLSSTIILTNLLIILAIGCNRRLHTTPNYFFLSLLVADLGMGVALPFIPWMGLSRPLSFGACLMVHVLPNFLFLAFLFNLVMVHYERYLSIVSPLRHRSFWVHRRFPLVLLALWLPPLLFALLPAFGWNNRRGGRARSGCCRPGAAQFGGGATGHVEGGATAGASTEPNCSLSAAAGSGSGERCCTYRHVFPNAFIYLEVYGILVPAILSIAMMTGRVLWITHGQLKDIRRLQLSVTGRGRGGRQLGVDLRYARCVAAVSLTFLACWVPYIIYTHVGMAFLLRPGAEGNPTAHIVLSCAGVGGMAAVPLVLGLANREYTDPVRKFVHKLHNRWRQRRRWDAESIAL